MKLEISTLTIIKESNYKLLKIKFCEFKESVAKKIWYTVMG